jgi:hypothetical protein
MQFETDRQSRFFFGPDAAIVRVLASNVVSKADASLVVRSQPLGPSVPKDNSSDRSINSPHFHCVWMDDDHSMSFADVKPTRTAFIHTRKIPYSINKIILIALRPIVIGSHFDRSTMQFQPSPAPMKFPQSSWRYSCFCRNVIALLSMCQILFDSLTVLSSSAPTKARRPSRLLYQARQALSGAR